MISPRRGIIYDANGEVLARNIAVDTVSVNPGKFAYANGKKVEDEMIATGLAQNLGLDYQEVLEKVKKNSSVVVIAKKMYQ